MSHLASSPCLHNPPICVDREMHGTACQMSGVRTKWRSSAPVTVQDQEATAVCAGVHGLLHHLRFHPPDALSEQALILQHMALF